MQKQSKNYNDVKLFLILIPLINVINYYLTYDHIALNWHTVLTFSIDIIEGYMAWLLFRYIIFYWDKKLPFERAPVKRIVLQIVTTLLGGLSVIILLTELINFIFNDKAVPRNFYTTDIFIIAIWVLVINGIYIGMYLYGEWQKSKIANSDEELMINEARKLLVKGFVVRTGRTELMVPHEEIAAFFTEDDYTVCSTVTDKKYLLEQSLDKIENELPRTLLFRLNRQVLIHRQMVVGFQRIENGKLNVLITASKHISSPVSVSRTKAAAFKNWFQPEMEVISI
jgi:hypothetical protein